ncbi:MAG: hypothetical protein U0353_28700 [Sandaracinus sp.]
MWVLAWAVLFAWVASASAQAVPPDLVRMHDGSFVRGTVVESTPSRIVIQLATGEIRTIDRGLVAELRSSDHATEASAAPTEAVEPVTLVGRRVLVQLHDGTALFGDVSTDTPSGVTVALDDGTARLVTRSDIAAIRPLEAETHASTSRASDAAGAPDAANGGAGEVTLHVTADEPGVSLHRLSSTVTVPTLTGRVMSTALVDQFAVLCNVPCDLGVPVGTYQLGVARGTSRAHRVGPPLTVGRSGNLHIEIDSREIERIVGLVVLFGPGLAGFATTIAGAFVGVGACIGMRDCNSLEVGVPYFISGGVVLAIALAVGIPLAAFSDHVAVRW